MSIRGISVDEVQQYTDDREEATVSVIGRAAAAESGYRSKVENTVRSGISPAAALATAEANTRDAHRAHCGSSGFSITVAHYPIVGVRGSAIAVPAGDNFPSDQASGSHVDARHEREELLESLAKSVTRPTNTCII